MIEEIIDYQEGTSSKIEVSEHSMPLISQNAEMKVEAVDANTCDIFMTMDFVVKGGPFGWIMGLVMMRPLMKWVTKNILTGLALSAFLKFHDFARNLSLGLHHTIQIQQIVLYSDKQLLK